MRTDTPHFHMTAWRAALVGAALMALVCALFWTTAAAGSLPEDTPEFIRAFTPARGIEALVNGLFWSMLFGATLAAALYYLYETTRRRGGRG